MRAPALIGLAVALLAGAAIAAAPGEWPTYGGDAAATRFSRLTQITPQNVGRLQRAWTYKMRPAGLVTPGRVEQAGDGGARVLSRYIPSQATPLVVGGRMYVATPYGRVVALDPATGRELWVHELPDGDMAATRGVEYWAGDRLTPARILVATREARLIALDAASGAAVAGFGAGGILNLKTPEVTGGVADAQYSYSSPPLVVRDVVVTGSRVQEAPGPGAYGDVRGWDVRTGKLLWTFHAVPRPGEFGAETWAGDSWKQRSGVNVWSFFTADVERGIVYMPFGAPAWDRYGGDRRGANLFSSSVVAVDVRTGKRLWHFQTVHHDIWDHDVPAAPTLVEVKRGQRTIPAIAVINKTSLLFLLDRVTGKPIYEVVEKPVPPSDVPGEEAWPTQPIPSKPPPLGRQGFTAATDVATLTPELKTFCERWIAEKKIRDSVQYTPLTVGRLTARFPGSGGGANWGGGGFDPRLGYFVINVNEMGSAEELQQRPDGSWFSPGGPNAWFADNKNRWMCHQPPWGSLYAVNVNTGEIAWTTPLGRSDNLPAAMAKTGRPNAGGPLLTAGGLVFIGAADDGRFRAFDTRTGQELWSLKLEAAAHANPVSYLAANGRQYVAVVATGGGFVGTPTTADSVIAFALPRSGAAAGGEVQARARPPSAAPLKVGGSGPPADPQVVMQRACSGCHELAPVLATPRRPAEWSEILSRMVARGARIDDREAALIEAYLNTHHGVKSQ